MFTVGVKSSGREAEHSLLSIYSDCVSVVFRFLTPVVFYANVGGWVRQNFNRLLT